MATAPNQGIMALPQSDQAPPPPLTLEESYDAVRQGLHNASPSTSQAVNGMMDKMAPLLAQIDDATLDKLLQLMQFLKQHPEQYQAILAKLMQSGAVQPGVFPPEYNPEFVATLGTVLLHEKMKRQRGNPQGAPQQPAAPAMEPPATMATGGIANAARAVREHSRGNDTILAHINPREVEILKAHGGIGTMNPTTGLPEFDFWSDLTGGISHALNAVADGVKSVLSSPVGKVLGTIALATFLGPVAGAWALPAASAGVTLAAGGNLKDALISGATAYFAAPGGVVSDFVSSFGGAMAAPAVNAALSAGLVGTGAGLLSGQSLENSVKNGLVAGAISGGTTMLAGGPGGEKAAIEDHSAMGQPNNPVAPAAQPVSGQSPTGQAVSGNANLGAAQAPATPAPSLVMGPPDTYQSAAQGVQAPAQVAPAPGAFTNDIALANAAKGAPAPGGYQAPTIGQAAEDMFGGIKNASWDQFQKGATEMFSPGMTAAQKDAAIQGYMDKGMSYADAAKRVADQAPGMVRTYGPAVAAGIGALGLGGGFQANPVESPMKNDIMSQLAQQRAEVAANPGKYVPKGMERFGILYDTQGRIIGSQPWSPAKPSFANTEVASTSVPYTPGTLMHAATGGSTSKGIGALGNGNYPTDTASYPRKTGAIQGPGTETSDSIPAMLSDGEFVMTAKAVRGAGKGNKLAGAKKMYALMHQLERNATRG